MSKRKNDISNPTTVVDSMLDLIKDPKNSSETDKNNNSEEEPQAKLEDIIKEIEEMVDEPTAKKRPTLARLDQEEIVTTDGLVEGSKVIIPKNRVRPLRENWERIYELIVEKLRLQVRFNTKTSQVELRKCEQTKDPIALQRATDFLRAFTLGFELNDAESLIRIDELFLETFKITDIKQTLKGDHLARAIGRIAGTGGRNKHTIENATKTRIVLADTKVSILGSFQNCRTARRTICAVVMGTPNNKIHGTLRTIAERMGDRY